MPEHPNAKKNAGPQPSPTNPEQYYFASFHPPIHHGVAQSCMECSRFLTPCLLRVSTCNFVVKEQTSII